MKDIKVSINGHSRSFIDMTAYVTDKELSKQKCLLNISTTAGSDPLYEDRGTTLLKDVICGKVIDNNDAVHCGNYAALDTLFFTSSQEYKEAFTKNNAVTGIELIPKELEDLDSVAYNISFTFSDTEAYDTIMNIEV